MERIVPSVGTRQEKEEGRASNGLFVRAVLTQIALPAAGITLCTQLGRRRNWKGKHMARKFTAGKSSSTVRPSEAKPSGTSHKVSERERAAVEEREREKS